MAAGEGLHQKEPQEAVETLRTILQVLGTFKSFYFEYKARLSEEAPERQWKVQTGALFGRLDEFLERVHDVLDINLTSLQFSKLGGKRSLQLIDFQNLFCEIGKYARVAHPEFAGASGRTRIKQ